MAVSRTNNISYLKKVFYFTHATGVIAGLIFPFVVSPMIGQVARSLPFIISCVIMG